jgi:serine protease AprX
MCTRWAGCSRKLLESLGIFSIAFLLTSIAPGPLLAAPPDPRGIHLRAGSFDPVRELPPTRRLPARSRYSDGVRGAHLVQFEGPIGGAQREVLEALGIVIGGSLPSRVLETVMTEAQRRAVERLPEVRWVGPYQDDWKIAARLLDALEADRTPRRVALRVSLFAGADEEGVAALRALGARVRSQDRARSFSLVDIEVSTSRVRALLKVPLVRHVQFVPTRVFHNDRARFHMGLEAIADDTFTSGLDPSLDGFDEASEFRVKYGHSDSGLWSVHPDFQAGVSAGRITWEAGSLIDDVGGHGTHTAGSIIGDGSSWNSVPSVPPGSGAVSENRWRGVQPEAALHHISMQNVTDEREIFETHPQQGAHILTNSWGLAECATLFCPLITDYDASAALWDEGVWDAQNQEAGLQPITVFFAAGNAGFEMLTGCSLFGGKDNITSPGTAKNVITVTASETDRGCALGEGDYPGDVVFSSSRGPVDPDVTGQGLFKPDIAAVGGAFVLSTERDGTGGVNSPSGFDDPVYCSNTGADYRFEGGTSMACPAAAGAGGVLVQDLVVNLGVAAPAPSLVKALLINGAEAIEPSGACDYTFETNATTVHRGWGLIRADASLYGPDRDPDLRDVLFENEDTSHALATGEEHQIQVSVAPGDELKVTLVWTDFPAAPGAGSPLVVNDLDLEVGGPTDTYLGNNFVGDWSGARNTETGTNITPDRYNVVENVYIPAAVGGTYTIKVRAEQVSQDQEPDLAGVNQDFSLVWSTSSIDATPVPEPGSVPMLLSGLALLAGLSRRREARRPRNAATRAPVQPSASHFPSVGPLASRSGASPSRSPRR